MCAHAVSVSIPCAESLAAASLASFQGPALLAYNDGKVFSEEDYASISSLGNSMKKDQKGKTGRFGVGFNAAYHLTDLPSFVSGKLTLPVVLCCHRGRCMPPQEHAVA